MPDYEVVLPQLLSAINITKGNLQHVRNSTLSI